MTELSSEELLRQIEERRADSEFMGRLRTMIDGNRDVLDRLADHQPSHMQFIGGTIYCPVKSGRLNLGRDHRYGRSFICPHCKEGVTGRLDDEQKRA